MDEAKRQDEIAELVLAARFNLDNLTKVVPGLGAHPYFRIVRYQLRCAECLILRKEPPESIEEMESIPWP